VERGCSWPVAGPSGCILTSTVRTHQP